MAEYIVTLRRSRNLTGVKASDKANLMTHFIGEVEKTTDVHVKDRSDPNLLVIEGNDETIKTLKSRFGDQLIIEPNSKLRML